MSRSVTFYDRKVPKKVVERLSSLEDGIIPEDSVEKFEKRSLDMVGGVHALATCNSTAALHLAMCALDLKRGDKVLCSVNSYADLPEVVRHFDAEPIFVDCESTSYNMNPAELEKSVSKNRSKKLRAVIVNHIAGRKADMSAICEIAQANGLVVIEDRTDLTAPSDIVDRDDEPGGAMKIYGFGSKRIDSFDAGLLVFDSDDYYERAHLLRNHGIPADSSGVDYIYDIYDIGCQYRLDGYGAIYASVLLDSLRESLTRRLELAKIYRNELDGLSHLSLPSKGDIHIYSEFMVEIDKNRDAFARSLKGSGIEVGVSYMPLHLSRYYKEKYGLKIFDFPSALGVYQRVMSLPLHDGMDESDIRFVCEAVKSADLSHI